MSKAATLALQDDAGRSMSWTRQFQRREWIAPHSHRFCCPSQGLCGSSLEQKQSSYHPSMPYGYFREPYTLYG
jgi:hypothetical protein